MTVCMIRDGDGVLCEDVESAIASLHLEPKCKDSVVTFTLTHSLTLTHTLAHTLALTLTVTRTHILTPQGAV